MRLIGKGKPKPEGSPKLVELVHVSEGMPRPLSVSFPDSTVNIPGDGFYEADGSLLDMTQGAESRRLTFTQPYPGELKVEKTFTFHPDKYSFELEVRVHNLGGAPLNQNGGLTWYQYVDPAAPTDSYGHDGPVSYIAKSIDRPEVKKMEADKTLGPDVSWGGFESKYFIASLIPQNPSLTSFRMTKDSSNLIAVGLKGPKNVIPPGQPGLFNYSLYLGPKDYSLLKAQNLGLENAIDFGDWLKWLAIPLLVVLKFLYGYVHNYGIAIIILTILIKLIFWPLGNKSYKSMKEMQKLQPKMAALREKYKGDKAQAQPGIDGPLQGPQGQSHGGMPADGRADPRLLRPLQGAALRDRTASLPPLLVDSGPLREGPLLHHADHHGRHDVHPAEDDPHGGRPHAGEDHALYAHNLHLHVPQLPVGTGHLLAVQQHHQHRPAGVHQQTTGIEVH